MAARGGAGFRPAVSVAIPPLVSPVIDLTGTLSDADIGRLERQALALQKSSGGQLQIVILSTTAPESIEDYAQRTFNTWGLGRRGADAARLNARRMPRIAFGPAKRRRLPAQ